MKRYQQLNNIFGWLVFLISGIVYTLTLEPTASFWDCSEFISSAYKLEPGHAPGSPIFMLTGRFFANFASDPSQVAWMVNFMSGLFSAGTILFLFWSITHLTRKLTVGDKTELSTAEQIVILGCGLVGSLLYAFTDTFWFSAVEGEVYAYSSFCTAIVFWLILKWEQVAAEPHADRYLILIAYLIGISIGVHLLNLLCIPAIVLVYYYKKKPEAGWKGTIIALLLSFILIAAILYGLIPGFIKVASWAELFFVNTIGLPFNSGVAIYFLLVAAVIAWGVYETYSQKSDKRIKLSFLLSVSMMGVPFIGSSIWIGFLLIIALSIYLFTTKKLAIHLINTIMLCLMVLFIGYASYGVILIRAVADPPMNENSPDNIFALGKYMNREQYGDGDPLVYGKTFVSIPYEINEDKSAPIWSKKIKESPDQKDQYYISGYKMNVRYLPELDMLFPRMHNTLKPELASAYKAWSNFKGKPVTVRLGGEEKTILKPTFADNLRFFINYQINFMYWRYFMWNFSGRQNDIQGHGNMLDGNWLTGFNFLDSPRLGDQSTLPDSMASNRGRNVYYMMPLILGLIGLLYQFYKGKTGIHQFNVVFMLFFMTGLAIVIYLNQSPQEPRERDYAYAGSFYAFSIWIGLGVAATAQWLSKRISKKISAIVATLLCLIVPFQMLSQNWDDHDRSRRTLAHDFGMNMLNSLDQDGILFTYGDNDTFPLWYMHETEGVRTDTRVCNFSYLGVDWYIDQMRKPAYESPGIPMSMPKTKYYNDTNNVVEVQDLVQDPVPLNSVMEFVLSDDPQTKIGGRSVIPARKVFIPIDSAIIAATGIGPNDSIPPVMNLNIQGDNITKEGLALLDMINTNSKQGWKRPMYFASRVKENLGLEPYGQQTGMVVRLTPTLSKNKNQIDTENSYKFFTEKARWGGTDDPKSYHDENSRRIADITRMTLLRLAKALIVEGKLDQAETILDLFTEKITPEAVIPNETFIDAAGLYFSIGKIDKGKILMAQIGDQLTSEINWFLSLTPNQFGAISNQVVSHLQSLQMAILYLQQYQVEDLYQKYNNFLESYKKMLNIADTPQSAQS